MRSSNKFARAVLVACALWQAPVALADESAEEDTISVVDENATPEGVVNTIRLPEKTATQPAAEQGGDSAAAARSQSRALGTQISKDVRSKNAAEQARDKAVRGQKQAEKIKKDKKDKNN